MMVSKARLFDDDEILTRILDAPDPKSAKGLDLKVKNFDDDVWESNCRRMV